MMAGRSAVEAVERAIAQGKALTVVEVDKIGRVTVEWLDDPFNMVVRAVLTAEAADALLEPATKH